MLFNQTMFINLSLSNAFMASQGTTLFGYLFFYILNTHYLCYLNIAPYIHKVHKVDLPPLELTEDSPS